MTDYALALEGITCTFRAKDDHSQGYTAVGDTSLRIRAGEFVSVVGPTGCGKSTLLKIGAGLLAPSLGWSAWVWAALVTVIRTSCRAACANALHWPRCWHSTPTLF